LGCPQDPEPDRRPRRTEADQKDYCIYHRLMATTHIQRGG
jgi:hypothetical protein